MINANVIQEIKTKTDLIALFGHYGQQPKKNGKGYTVCCPFHEETQPSLSINVTKNLWQCFGCGEAGDAISLVQKLEKISFVEAVKKLAMQQGYSQADLEVESEKTCPDLFQNVMAHYRQTFLAKTEGRAYLKQRGISEPWLKESDGIGYADGSLLDCLPPESVPQLIEAGLLLAPERAGAAYRERFVNCVVFPLMDDAGYIVSFYGRHIQMEHGGHFYLPGERRGLFNAQQLKENKSTSLIITESIIDALSFINKGIVNVLALYGTNGFTNDHGTLIKELQPTQIILALDGDEAGRQASIRLAKNALFSFNCALAVFPDDQDANDYFLTHDKADFERLMADGNDGQLRRVAHSPTATTTVLREPQGKLLFQIKYVELKQGKLNATVKVQQGDKFLLDTYNLYSQKHRETLTTEAAKLLAKNPESLAQTITQLIADCESKANDKEPPRSLSGASQSKWDCESNHIDGMTDEEKQAAIAYLKQPDLLSQIVKDYETLGYTGEEINKQLAYLVMTSRKLKNPLSMIISSNSAAGKSSLQKVTLELCPPEDSKHFTRLTQQSLYYLGENSLKHKFISIEEEEGSSDAGYSLKTMLSAKVLHVASTTTDPQTGRMKADEYRAEGPIAVMVSTTSPDIEPELASRTLLITIDESKEQTSRIHDKQRTARTLEGRLQQQERESILRLHHNLQRTLDSNLVVINNYADQLTFPSDRLKHRRGHDQYLDLIETIAFLRQQTKLVKSADSVTNGFQYIEVEKDDIRLANEIFTQALGLSIDELKPATRMLLRQIVEHCQKGDERLFTRRQIREACNWESVALHRHLKALEDLDYICLTAPSINGQRHQYELLYDGQTEPADKFVIGLKNVDSL